VNSTNGYAGSIGLDCVLTSSPSGAQHTPGCTIDATPVTLSSSTSSATATISFITTAPSAVPGSIARNTSSRFGLKTGAAVLLGLLVLLGIPARNRAWRAMLGVLILIAAFGAVAACGGGGGGGTGGGGSGSGGGGNSNPGTTAGTYTFTITGTGNPAVTPAPATTITLTVN
jgi:hypothetical protein